MLLLLLLLIVALVPYYFPVLALLLVVFINVAIANITAIMAGCFGLHVTYN